MKFSFSIILTTSILSACSAHSHHRLDRLIKRSSHLDNSIRFRSFNLSSDPKQFVRRGRGGGSKGQGNEGSSGGDPNQLDAQGGDEGSNSHPSSRIGGSIKTSGHHHNASQTESVIPTGSKHPKGGQADNVSNSDSGKKGGKKGGKGSGSVDNTSGNISTSTDDSRAQGSGKSSGSTGKGAKATALASTDHNSGSTSGDQTGTITFYSQDGTEGACGNGMRSDSDLVVALAPSIFREHCGKSVTITNTLTGHTVTAECNDECPSCADNHIDVSIGCWAALGSPQDLGVAPVTFTFDG